MITLADVDTEICAFPSLPLLVVTRITPLAPLTPKTAVAEASFNTVMLSTSFGSISLKSLSTPSTCIKGEESAHVALPRTRTVAASAPGSPEYWIEDKPETAPESILVIEPTGVFNNSEPFMPEIAPVTVTFFCVP